MNGNRLIPKKRTTGFKTLVNSRRTGAQAEGQDAKLTYFRKRLAIITNALTMSKKELDSSLLMAERILSIMDTNKF